MTPSPPVAGGSAPEVAEFQPDRNQRVGRDGHPVTGDAVMTLNQSGAIYAAGATLYRQAGWRAPLPIRPGTKGPPPTGWTGHDGAWPSEEQVNAWKQEKHPESNLGLRLQYGLVGIDVDAYDGKTGGRTLKEAESRWGPLLPTYRSSSRI